MKSLYLFTNQYPYKGGEPFLETEIHYLSKAFDRVIIYPLLEHGKDLLKLPSNVEVIDFNINQPVYLRKLLLKHGWIIAKWFLIEFIKSPHRFKYILEFSWNFKRLVGLLNAAVGLTKELNNKDMIDFKGSNVFYTYWFNEWASILILANELGLKIDILTRVHLYDFEEEFSKRKYLPFRYTEFSKVKEIAAISEYAIHYLKKRFPPQKISLNRLGVNDNSTNTIDNTSSQFTIVTCSGLFWYKRPMLLIELLKQFNLNINWIHFGDGLMEKEFIEGTKDLPININFNYKGRVPNSEVINFYKNNSVDLLLNVSLYEGIPVSLMEAINVGIPIIGCNVCGIPEIINAKTGLLLDVNFNIKEASELIENFLKFKSRDLIFRESVKHFWKENFDADKNYTEFVNNVLNG